MKIHPKIYSLGKPELKDLFTSDSLVIQEKVDGSQFGVGRDENGQIFYKSKHKLIDIDNVPNLFIPAVEYLESLQKSKPDIFDFLVAGDILFFETLYKEKHNTIKYNRAPINNLLLFGGIVNGQWIRGPEFKSIASKLDVELIKHFEVTSTDKDSLMKLLETESQLGGSTIEGIVIKNYDIPIMGKLVNKEFFEVKETKCKTPQFKKDHDAIIAYFKLFATEARWLKAIKHLEEQNKLKFDSSDIGILCKEIVKDVLDEESETVKQFLINFYKKPLCKTVLHKFAIWYQNEYLLNRQFNK